MEILLKNLKIFIIGAVGYGIIETLFRGYTHWTMLITGGFCFLIIFHIYTRNEKAPIWQKCLVGAIVITTIEFTVGCIVNLWLGWDVWDYSRYSFNILGQVCLAFTVAWYLLCIPLTYFARFLRLH